MTGDSAPHKEIKRRTNIVGIFPNEAAIVRLVGAILIEQNDERSAATAGRPRRQLIEPPFDLESHRYQTVHAADWIASLVGRLGAFWKEPEPGRLPLPHAPLRACPITTARSASAMLSTPSNDIQIPPPSRTKRGHFNFAERGHYGFGLTGERAVVRHAIADMGNYRRERLKEQLNETNGGNAQAGRLDVADASGTGGSGRLGVHPRTGRPRVDGSRPHGCDSGRGARRRAADGVRLSVRVGTHPARRIGAVDNSARGVWTITEAGRRTESADQMREPVRRQREEYGSGLRKAHEKPDNAEDTEDEASGESGEESWQAALLGILREMKPDAFERLCQRLLREHGFTRVEVTGRSGDGGIDGTGVLRVNLLSFHVNYQCKRYAGTVGPGSIRDFRGALAGRAHKGLFITTAGSRRRPSGRRSGTGPWRST